MRKRYIAAISAPLILGFAAGATADEWALERPAYRPLTAGRTCQKFVEGRKLVEVVYELVEINGQLFPKPVSTKVVKENPTLDEIKGYKPSCEKK